MHDGAGTGDLKRYDDTISPRSEGVTRLVSMVSVASLVQWGAEGIIVSSFGHIVERLDIRYICKMAMAQAREKRAN